MKAAVIYEHGGAGSIKVETNFPDPVPGPNDVIVRVRATSSAGRAKSAAYLFAAARASGTHRNTSLNATTPFG